MVRLFESRIALAYEVGRGIKMAEEEVFKNMDDLVDDKAVADTFLKHNVRVQKIWRKRLGDYLST
jgi:CRISPR/Cas system CSM-associated protein Csm2 small subunit